MTQKRRARGERKTTDQAGSYRTIEDDAAFAQLCEELLSEERIGIDTEFVSEKRYFAQLGLLQLSWRDQVAIVDPLRVDVTRLAPVLAGDTLTVGHALEADLEIIERAIGVRPARIFDTQVAASLLMPLRPGLRVLCQNYLGIALAKGEQVTDWTKRPLSESQKRYAASDVAHLMVLHELLVEKLTAAGRLEWAIEECEAMRTKTRGAAPVEQAWWGVKGWAQMKGETRRVAQSVAAWRETQARRRDCPPRFVLGELALMNVINAKPATREELGALRGLEAVRKDSVIEGLLAAVRDGMAMAETDVVMPERVEVDHRLDVAAGFMLLWINAKAIELDMEPAMLATRADLVSYLRGDSEARVTQGWREGILARELADLRAGRAKLRLDASGHKLVCELGE